MEYRRPSTQQDYEQMVELQNRNLFSVLAPAERLDGFLNTSFTVSDFQQMNQSIGVIVAVEDNQVKGYLCAASLEYYRSFPFPAACIYQADKIQHQTRVLSDYRVCLVNPICIDQAYRGGEVFMRLCQAMLEVLAQTDYEIALAFVAKANTRSLHACQKMMNVVGQFSKNGHAFSILIRNLNRSVP